MATVSNLGIWQKLDGNLRGFFFLSFSRFFGEDVFSRGKGSFFGVA